MCAEGRPLQATSHPEWVGHVTMMISSTLGTRPSIELSELCSPGFDFGRHFGRTRAYTLRIASPISGVDITRLGYCIQIRVSLPH